MILELKCQIQGTVMVEATFPYFFEKIHRPHYDENQVFASIVGVIVEGLCVTITQGYNEHQQGCFILNFENYESIAESKCKEYYHPFHQSSRERFMQCLGNAQRWFVMQEKYMNLLKVLPP